MEISRRRRDGKSLRNVGIGDSGLTGDFVVFGFEAFAGLEDDHEVLDGVFGHVLRSHGDCVLVLKG
jgi:hypothetical protein